jgi:hypothetical protein
MVPFVSFVVMGILGAFPLQARVMRQASTTGAHSSAVSDFYLLLWHLPCLLETWSKKCGLCIHSGGTNGQLPQSLGVLEASAAGGATSLVKRPIQSFQVPILASSGEAVDIYTRRPIKWGNPCCVCTMHRSLVGFKTALQLKLQCALLKQSQVVSCWTFNCSLC